MAIDKGIHKERETGRQNPSAKIDTRPTVQALAYQLWLERGAPIGSPQADWFEAEARLTSKGRREK